MRHSWMIVLAVVALIQISNSSANVSLKNGNFFIGYTDVVYNGGFEPKIERVYNSKTSFKGIFGHGWGTEIEAHLKVSPDGSVVVFEYGGGSENRFVPVGIKTEDAQKTIAPLIAIAKSNGYWTQPYQDRLKNDLSFRNDEWDKWVRAGKLKNVDIKVGTQFKSNKFSYQYVTKTAQGYIRTFDNGRQENYDLSGKLTRIQDKTGNFITMTYKGDVLDRLIDNQNRKMFFTFNPRKLLEKIEIDGKKEAVYKYNAMDELISSRDIEGNTYGYVYSGDQRHNLTEIGYSNGTKMQISYYGKEVYENVKSVKDRDGTYTEYKYTYKNGRSQFQVSVSLRDKEGKEFGKQSYEYWVANKADGEEYTQKLIAEIEGEKTETTYHPDFGLPTSIKKNGEENKFAYDLKGRVIMKETPLDITNLQYDQKVGKISKVSRVSKASKKDMGWSTFEYDPANGNLTSAKNSQNKGVKLIYDSLGRITTMVDNDKRRIDFKYNADSKPIEITDAKLGMIKVEYGSKGEIKSVDSPAGKKVAMDVTSAFQNLLEIIKPAGVSLSF